MAGCEDERKLAVAHSEGIPCLQSRVASVIKALQATLDVLSVRQIPWCLMYTTMSTCWFFFPVYWYRTDLTLVVSSPSAGTSMVFISFFLHAWPGFLSGGAGPPWLWFAPPWIC